MNLILYNFSQFCMNWSDRIYFQVLLLYYILSILFNARITLLYFWLLLSNYNYEIFLISTYPICIIDVHVSFIKNFVKVLCPSIFLEYPYPSFIKLLSSPSNGYISFDQRLLFFPPYMHLTSLNIFPSPSLVFKNCISTYIPS